MQLLRGKVVSESKLLHFDQRLQKFIGIICWLLNIQFQDPKREWTMLFQQQKKSHYSSKMSSRHSWAWISHIKKEFKDKTWISKPVFLTKAIRNKVLCHELTVQYAPKWWCGLLCVNSLYLFFVSIVKTKIFQRNVTNIT